MATLPLEIVFYCILTRLPVKTLNRFKCVSKSFLAEISSPNFVKLHHLTALSSDANRFLVLSGWDQNSCNRGLYMYDLDSLHAPPSFCPLLASMRLVASCECYLLVQYEYGYHGRATVILINPSICTYRQLPYLDIPRGSSTIHYGLCHCSDELGHDFKVVRIVDFFSNSFQRQVAVCSLRSGLWKLIDCTTHDDYVSTKLFRGVLLQKHLFHLIFMKMGVDRNQKIKKIGSFDIMAERWGPDVPLPNVRMDVVDFELVKPFDLGALDEQLCFVVKNTNEPTYDLWVMREYGVKDYWVKLMSLSVFDNPPCLPPSPPATVYNLLPRIAYHPLTRLKGSHELFCKRDRSFKLFRYNLEDKESVEAKFRGLPAWGFSTAYVCKGSLLNIHGGQSISAWCLKEQR